MPASKTGVEGEREDQFLEHGRKGVMEGLGFHPRFVERPKLKGQAIDAARTIFSTCQFDEQACDLGLKRLRHYRKDWDEERGVWRDRPHHDDASHAADAYMTFATSNYQPPVLLVMPKRDLAWVI